MQFLFGESQADEEISAIVEDIADMSTEGATTIKVEKAPLAKALKDIGIDASGLENDPRGLSLVFPDGESYRAAHTILNEPDSLHKLASAGWVYSTQGDVAMANEPAEFRIRFLEIDNVEPSTDEPKPTSGTATNKKLSVVIKKAREFASKKPEHDENNPIEFDGKAKSDGLGKAKDGSQPEGSLKMEEGRHKTGCQCGFCKNMGNIHKRGKNPTEDEPAEDEPTEKEPKGEETAESVAARLLDSNPGTPPGITGHKSYPGMKIGSPDRKFSPAKGMVQPTGDTGSVVNPQTKRKKSS